MDAVPAQASSGHFLSAILEKTVSDSDEYQSES